MGTIRTVQGKKKTTYFARVRLDGGRINESGSFATYDEADRWIKKIEGDFARGLSLDYIKVKKMTLNEIFDDFIELSGETTEKIERVKRLKNLIGNVLVGELSSVVLENFIKELGKIPAPTGRVLGLDENGEKIRAPFSSGTIRKYYFEIKSALKFHSKKFDYEFNRKPWDDSTPPPAWENPRDAFVSEEDFEKLILACDYCHKKNRQNMKNILTFLYYSGCRPGEVIQKLKFKDFHFDDNEPYKSYIEIPKQHQKSRAHESITTRYIPMGPELYDLCKKLCSKSHKPESSVFPYWNTSTNLSERFKVIRKHAKLEHLQIYILRHTAITKFVNSPISPLQASYISGHSDLKTMARYYKKKQSTSEIGKILWNK